MINTYARRADVLVELGCGRGGDLSKWRDAGVHSVVALDLSASQLDDARGREHSGAKNTQNTRVEWVHGSVLDPFSRE